MARGDVTGTAVAAGRGTNIAERDVDPAIAFAFERANELIRQAYEEIEAAGAIHKPMPVGRVQWIHISRVQANDYNPNAVAGDEMRLLHTSISEDGYTQPVVAIWDPEAAKYIIVDGFHRFTTMKRFQDIYDATEGYLPVVVIDKPIGDRIASTVRHNRARGKHSVAGMGNLIFQLLEQGMSDAEICTKVGVDPEELARLKHITGYSKLFRDVTEYSKVVLTGSQMMAKADYKKEHPDEQVPGF